MRYLLLCLALLCGACADTTAPAPSTNLGGPTTDALVLVSSCSGNAVWEVYVDGARLGLFLMPPDAGLSVATTRGTHSFLVSEWAPVAREIGDTVAVSGLTRVPVPCR